MKEKREREKKQKKENLCRTSAGQRAILDALSSAVSRRGHRKAETQPNRRRARAAKASSKGIKYCTQSKMKLALSGLLNRSEGAVSLFRSHTCDSNHGHTSNYTLIVLKMKKKKVGWGCTQTPFFFNPKTLNSCCCFLLFYSFLLFGH